jgi:hypothetical protein
LNFWIELIVDFNEFSIVDLRLQVMLLNTHWQSLKWSIHCMTRIVMCAMQSCQVMLEHTFLPSE